MARNADDQNVSQSTNELCIASTQCAIIISRSHYNSERASALDFKDAAACDLAIAM